MRLGAIGGAGAATVGTWTASLYAGAFFSKLSIKSYKLQSPQWPKDYKPLKIAFLTDLHVGCQSVDLHVLEKIVGQVNALGAEIILLGGDFLTYNKVRRWSNYVAPALIAEVLKPLDAPLGVYSVLGNHDWYSDGFGMWRALEKTAKIRVMENHALYIPFHDDGFWLLGLADYLTRNADYAGTLQKAKGAEPKIVVSHDPFTYKDLNAPIALQLSGHTHGGQVALPLIGPVVSPTPGTPFEWFYGLIEGENGPMIVSSGVGTSQLPIKNTPCEVVMIEISAA
jgi:predicted MPP superfamily phosphohydrolase